MGVNRRASASGPRWRGSRQGDAAEDMGRVPREPARELVGGWKRSPAFQERRGETAAGRVEGDLDVAEIKQRPSDRVPALERGLLRAEEDLRHLSELEPGEEISLEELPLRGHQGDRVALEGIGLLDVKAERGQCPE